MRKTRSIGDNIAQGLELEEKKMAKTLLGIIDTKKKTGLRKECSKN